MSEVADVCLISRPPQNSSVKSRTKNTALPHLKKKPVRPSPNNLPDQALEKKYVTNIPVHIQPTEVERRHSLNNLHIEHLRSNDRSLSASNLYALNNPNLSIKHAFSKKAYDKPNTSFGKEKAMFTALVQKYYNQLTVGCLNNDCINKFCKSSATGMRLKPAMAALVSIELSGYKDQYLCIKDEGKQVAKLLDQCIFKLNDEQNEKEANKKDIPFLYAFYSTTPFRSLFLPCPLTASGKSTDRRHSLTGVNESSSDSYTSSLRKHLHIIANTVSSSLTNIWRSTRDEKEPTCEIKNAQSVDSKPTTSSKRQRLPSIRMFPNNAVENEDEDFSEIEKFESSVAQEFKDGREVENRDQQSTGDNIDEFSLTHLTLEMFESVLANYFECTDESFLINTLRTVFSSWEALEISFCEEGLSQQKYAFNINREDVESMFERLKTVAKSKVLFAVLIDAVTVMLLSRKEHILQEDNLKPLAIMLEIPDLFDYLQVVQEVANVISGISVQCKSALVVYIQDLPVSKFQYVVQGFKSLLLGEISLSTPNKHTLTAICTTLQLFYDANSSAALVPPAAFYCEEITTKVDFKFEFARWNARKEANSFSILDYFFVLEPIVKVQVIHIDAITQMREEYQDAIVHQARVQQVQKSWSDFNDTSALSRDVQSAMCPYLLLEIRRQNIINDTLNQLKNKHADYKKPLKIKYTEGGEQGLDMGGLQKEFFQIIIETMFDPNYGLFILSEDSSLVWFNGFSLESIVMFQLVGILLGLAIYNGIILDLRFPLLVYKKLLDFQVTVEDLKEIQPTMYAGLKQLLDYQGDVEQDFQLTFEINHSVFGEQTTVELIPNGCETAVTNTNREYFVQRYVESILSDSVGKQFAAFKQGFLRVCQGPSIRLFTPPELELLICGSPELDFKALESVTEYKDGYTRDHPLMIEFWRIVHAFTFPQKQALLMFVTGSHRVPLKGLGSMSFYIQRNGPDSDNLPTSMTCFNRLLIPEYSTDAKLEKFLTLAISNSKGFGLT